MPAMLRFSSAWIIIFLLSVSRVVAAWPQIETDAPTDPAVHEGVLPNGLRYVIHPNKEPKGRVSLRLVVAVGSLHERDDERGLAHFVEHMAFRGTRAHPANSIVATLQRLGVGLGADNNAFTSNDSTVYHLELPDTHEATLREGLGVFREYAESITFEENQIEPERGVILSERTARNTPDLRLREAMRSFFFPDALENRRLPIGTLESIGSLSRSQFIDFYNAWYRPERMAVVVVGEVDPATVANLVRDVFASLQGRGAPRDEPSNVFTQSAGTPSIFLYRDPELTGISVTLAHPEPEKVETNTAASRENALRSAAAFMMLERRLTRAIRAGSTSYLAASAGIDRSLPRWATATVSVSGSLENWQVITAEVEKIHRQAMQFGFTTEEIEETRSSLSSMIKQLAETSATRTSPTLAAQIVSHLLTGQPLLEVAALQQESEAAIAALDPAVCLTAFRAAWSLRALHVLVAFNSAYSLKSEAIASTLNQSRMVDVVPPKSEAVGAFAYTDFGPTGQIVKEEHVKDLDVHLAKFANGVRLNARTMSNQAESMDIVIRVGTGSTPRPKLQGLDLFGSMAFISGGLAKHSVTELTKLFSGRGVSWTFSVGADCSALSAHCTRRDLLPCLQLLAAYLSDAGYRPEELRNVWAQFDAMRFRLASTPAGAIAVTAQRIMTLGDPRFSLPDQDEFYARTYQELAAWLDPQLKHGPLEIDLVGDVPWSEIVETTSRTFGALPTRDPPSATRPDPVKFSPLPIIQNVITLGTKNQCGVAFYWATPEVSDVYGERRCVMLAEVIEEKVRQKLRDELGATYVPTANFVLDPAIPQMRYFVVTAEVSSDHVKSAARIISETVATLLDKGIDEDTFVRVRKPMLRSREDDMLTHTYWLYSVLPRVQERPENLARARDRSSDVASITIKQLQKYLKQSFRRENTFVFAALPGRMSAATVAPSEANALDKVAKARETFTPNYPAALRAKGVQGNVTVEFVVDVNGRVVSAQAVSSPHAGLSAAAEEAVRRWTFEPAEKAGAKVNSRMRVELRFAMDEAK